MIVIKYDRFKNYYDNDNNNDISRFESDSLSSQIIHCLSRFLSLDMDDLSHNSLKQTYDKVIIKVLDYSETETTQASTSQGNIIEDEGINKKETCELTKESIKWKNQKVYKNNIYSQTFMQYDYYVVI
jgi:hypothetical protein